MVPKFKFGVKDFVGLKKGVKVIRVLLVVLFCLLLSSCAKNNYVQQSITKWHKKHNRMPIDRVQQQEAMLIDIPIPLYDERLPVYDPDSNSGHSTIMLGYKSSLDTNDIVDFYMKQMERLGWNCIKLFQGFESLLQFESPDRLCSVSVRPHHKRSRGADIIVFIDSKEDILS